MNESEGGEGREREGSGWEGRDGEGGSERVSKCVRDRVSELSG